MGTEDNTALIGAAEDWFVHNGIPHFIDDFTASEDVWTRAIGTLSAVFFLELFLTFGDDFSGWQQFGVFSGGLGLTVGAFVVINRLRGRPNFARPRTIGAGELALFVMIPPALALLGGHRDAMGVVQIILFNLAVLAVVYVVVSWGVFSMLRWGLVAMWHQITGILQLLGRVLPLMLLFSAFLFLNAEIWQVVNDLPILFFAGIALALAFIGLVFLVGSMTGAIAELRFFDSWTEVDRELASTPLEDCNAADFAGAPERVPLSRAARLNLTLRVVVGLSAQVLLVTLLIFGFYVAFGLVTVRQDTILQWTTLDSISSITLSSFSIGDETIVLTALHLVTAGIVASFSGLQFAVSLVTDENYRAEFVEESNAEVRAALAVRAAYLGLLKLSS